MTEVWVSLSETVIIRFATVDNVSTFLFVQITKNTKLKTPQYVYHITQKHIKKIKLQEAL